MWQEWCREQSQERLKRRCWGNWLRKCIWASAWHRWGSGAWRCLESFPEAGTTKARLWRGKMGDMFQQSKGWLQKVTVLCQKTWQFLEEWGLYSKTGEMIEGVWASKGNMTQLTCMQSHFDWCAQSSILGPKANIWKTSLKYWLNITC